MGAFVDRTGHTFGRLTAVERVENAPCNQASWRCECKCGKIVIVRGCNLNSGIVKSCGCSRIIHGCATRGGRTPEFDAWCRIQERCYNKNNDGYALYGGRGISVCERWRSSFEPFLDDMGKRPSSKHSIDRINNDGNYEPGNCRWATKVEQSNNRRTTVWIEAAGKVRTQTQWSRWLGGSPGLVSGRLSWGWTEEQATQTPVGGRRHKVRV